MEEYISKTVLLKFIETLEIKEDDDPGYNKGLNDALHKYFPQIINSVIVADVQEEKHAKWNINCDGYYPYCSNCKTEPPSRIMTKYCPNCGARMDLKE